MNERAGLYHFLCMYLCLAIVCLRIIACFLLFVLDRGSRSLCSMVLLDSTGEKKIAHGCYMKSTIMRIYVPVQLKNDIELQFFEDLVYV